MSDLASDPRKPLLSRISSSACPVYGLLFLVIGAVIGTTGALRLVELFKLAQTLFPLGSAEQTIERFSAYWPTAFSFFVSFIASISALLFGTVWAFGAIADIFRSRRTPFSEGGLNNPAEIASSLFPFPDCQEKKPESRWVSWPKAGRLGYSPISRILAKSALVSLFKIGFVWALVWLTIILIQSAPTLIQKSFSVGVHFHVPSSYSIHWLFTAAVALNILSLVFLLSRPGDPSTAPREQILIKGNFAPSFFLSIFENAFSLLNPKGAKSGASFKLRNRLDRTAIAALVESHPRRVRWLGMPIGLCLAPLSAFCVIWGYRCLMAFGDAKATSVDSNFASERLPTVITDIFFYVGLIWLGMYFAERLRIFLGVRRFESIVALCVLKPSPTDHAVHPPISSEQLNTGLWELEEGSGDELVSWAKSPGHDSRFIVHLSWWKIISESVEGSSSRHLFKHGNDAISDNLVHKVFELTQNIRFEKIPIEAGGGEPEQV